MPRFNRNGRYDFLLVWSTSAIYKQTQQTATSLLMWCKLHLLCLFLVTNYQELAINFKAYLNTLQRFASTCPHWMRIAGLCMWPLAYQTREKTSDSEDRPGYRWSWLCNPCQTDNLKTDHVDPCDYDRIVETTIRYLHAKMVFTTEAGCMPQDVIAASSTKQLKDEQSHLFLTKTIWSKHYLP